MVRQHMSLDVVPVHRAGTVFLCDGVGFEFGIDFQMLARCPRLGSMIRETT